MCARSCFGAGPTWNILVQYIIPWPRQGNFQEYIGSMNWIYKYIRNIFINIYKYIRVVVTITPRLVAQRTPPHWKACIYYMKLTFQLIYFMCHAKFRLQFVRNCCISACVLSRRAVCGALPPQTNIHTHTHIYYTATRAQMPPYGKLLPNSSWFPRARS